MIRKSRVLLFVAIFILPLVSGEIMFSQPDSVYNYGDEIDVEVTIKTDESSVDFYMFLECNDSSLSLYMEKGLVIDNSTTIQKSYSLSRDFLRGLKGDCNFVGRYGNQSSRSEEFKISSEISIDLISNSVEGEINNGVTVEGEGIKENGEKVDGYLNLSITGTNFSMTREVSGGDFLVNMTLPEVAAGNYSMNLDVYEKSGGEVTNYGSESMVLKVMQTPTKLVIKSIGSIKPGKELVITPKVLDQTNQTIQGEVGVVVSREEGGGSVYEDVVESGKNLSVDVSRQEKPGYWRITAKAFGLENSKLVKIEELERADFEIVNETLVIENTGNVNYRKPVKILIENKSIVKTFDLSPKEKIELGLSAPEGEHNITVTDGERSLTTTAYLTGEVVRIEEFEKGVSWLSKYPFVWVFLIFILGAFIFTFLYKTIKRKFYAYPVEGKGKKENSRKKGKGEEKTKVKKVGRGRDIEEAEHSLALNGDKEKVSLIALNTDSKEVREKASKVIKENKGAVYGTESHLFGIFSPITTKTFDNEMIGVNVGRKIKQDLDEYNKKTKEKAKYGLALSSGQLILEKGDKLKFTNVGGTMNKAKKIAQLSDNELLLSDEVSKEIKGEVKTSKESRKGVKVHSIKRVTDRKKYKKFINNFLERQKGEGDQSEK